MKLSYTNSTGQRIEVPVKSDEEAMNMINSISMDGIQMKDIHIEHDSVESFIETFQKKSSPKVGMKVKELATGRIAKITGVYDDDNEVWMVSGHDVGVFMLSEFWKLFEEV